ncbi:hypothetical protein CIG19_16745 [Enterobacterales bacterium CwR94]|nr:hypothetical protein CIG19_16745 [Enterobacterales bacterium CwR94]
MNVETGERYENYGDAGLTLRDYLAAKAMASIPLALDDGEQKLIANAAYRQADAMLAARASNN